MDYIKQIAQIITEDPDISTYAYAIIQNPRGEVLLQHSGNGWQFPGTKMIYGEAVINAICRCSEEMGLPIEPIRPMPLAYSADANYYLCQSQEQDLKRDDLTWFDPQDDEHEGIEIQGQIVDLLTRYL